MIPDEARLVKYIARKDLVRTAAYVDLAVSVKSTADYTCLAYLGITSAMDVVVLNIVRGRWAWPDARRVIASEVLRLGIRDLGIESVAFQLAAVQELQRMPELAHVAIRAVSVDKDKVSRALPLSARAEAGQLYLVKAGWNEDLIEELCSFPNGSHDDQVDALSGAFEKVSGYSGPLAVLL